MKAPSKSPSWRPKSKGSGTVKNVVLIGICAAVLGVVQKIAKWDRNEDAKSEVSESIADRFSSAAYKACLNKGYDDPNYKTLRLGKDASCVCKSADAGNGKSKGLLGGQQCEINRLYLIGQGDDHESVTLAELLDEEPGLVDRISGSTTSKVQRIALKSQSERRVFIDATINVSGAGTEQERCWVDGKLYGKEYEGVDCTHTDLVHRLRTKIDAVAPFNPKEDTDPQRPVHPNLHPRFNAK